MMKALKSMIATIVIYSLRLLFLGEEMPAICRPREKATHKRNRWWRKLRFAE